jgi:hypothetical protein
MRALRSWRGLLGTLALAILPAPAGGQAVGSEFQINTQTTSSQRRPSVAADASGGFVVAWSSLYQDASSWGIFGQRYDDTGGTLGSEFRVNSYTTSSQRFSSAASDASGNFVVVWMGYGQDGSGYGVFGQRYDSAGGTQEEEFQINSHTTSDQESPSVGATGTNQFIVAWQSDGQDGSDTGIFGQRFDFSGTQTITVVSPNTNVRWRIGTLQQIQWTHNLGPNVFRIELDRTDDGIYEELIAAAAQADNPTKGSFVWMVTGPPSGTARVRTSWTDDLSVSDSSDVTFQIRPAN